MLKNLLFVLAATTVACSRRGAPLTSWEGALLDKDWQRLETEADTSAVQRFVKAHARLARNENGRAVCDFVGLGSAADRAAWLSWAGGFATRNPGTNIAHYLLGDALARSGDLTSAKLEFGRAIELNAQDYLSLHARGVVFALVGDTAAAELDFDEAKAANPHFNELLVSSSFLKIQRQQPISKVDESFRGALLLSPQHPLAELGHAYVTLLRDRSGVSHFAKESNNCLAPLVASMIETALRSRAIGGRALLASADGGPGTTLRNDLTDALKGSDRAMRRVADLAAQDPSVRKQVEKTLESARRTDPQIDARYGAAVKANLKTAELNGRLLEAASAAKLEVGLSSGGAKVEVTGRGLKVGAEASAGVSARIGVDGGKALAPLRAEVDKKIAAAKQLQDSTTQVKNNAGGLASYPGAMDFDDGQYPRVVYYGLLYPAPAGFPGGAQ